MPARFPARPGHRAFNGPRDPLIAPRLPETPLYRLAFQSFPSLRLFPNLSSAPSLALIILDTYLWMRIVVSFCSLLA
ncbi:hypothetical protein BVI1335_350046 [Burkholderia vietnamiensis]|nr:hypothetical protein BVI1335_350046 [Burkholderia vietnamiensis]